jgi:hypothetical protein
MSELIYFPTSLVLLHRKLTERLLTGSRGPDGRHSRYTALNVWGADGAKNLSTPQTIAPGV